MKNVIRRSYKHLTYNYRRGTAQKRPLPDFIIVGAQKGGTSSLYYYLAQHPQIKSAIRKEIHYFDNAYEKGLDWYRSNFPILWESGGRRIMTGEASPYYIFHPHAMKRISKDVPDAKIIVLLRNPIDRAYSHYQMASRKGKESLSFEEAVRVERERLQPEIEKMLNDERYSSEIHQSFSYVSRGIYIDQLEAIFKYYSRDSVLILSSEDFFSDPQKSCSEVSAFLGLPPFTLKNPKAINVGKYTREVPGRDALCAFYEPHNQRLREFLGVDFGW